MKIKYSKKFVTQYDKAGKEIKQAFAESLQLFLEYPDHEILRRHFLKEKYAGYESIDITDDYRAVFKKTTIKKEIGIRFHLIGTDHELYGL